MVELAAFCTPAEASFDVPAAVAALCDVLFKNQPADLQLSSWSLRLQQMWKIEAPCGLGSRESMFHPFLAFLLLNPFITLLLEQCAVGHIFMR